MTYYACGGCGRVVSKDTYRCPFCGVRLSGIRCQTCGFAGSEADFVGDICPRCFARVRSTLGSLIAPARPQPATTRPAAATGPAPAPGTCPSCGQVSKGAFCRNCGRMSRWVYAFGLSGWLFTWVRRHRHFNMVLSDTPVPGGAAASDAPTAAAAVGAATETPSAASATPEAPAASATPSPAPATLAPAAPAAPAAPDSPPSGAAPDGPGGGA